MFGGDQLKKGTVILVTGSTGAGKTTYARKLAKKLPAVVYSIDNWMKVLFGSDMPDDPQPAWFYENQQWYIDRIARCEEQIKSLVASRAAIGQKSILDLGFATNTHRQKFISFFKDLNLPVEIHFLDVSAVERRRRVKERNKEKGDTFVMTVDDTLFTYMESIFEPPSEEEGVTLISVSQFSA